MTRFAGSGRLFIVIGLMLGGCESTTLIHSNPAGATVKSRGVTLGVTPLTIKDNKPSEAVTQLDLEKEGYLPSTLVIQRSYDSGSGAALLSLFCAPAVWAAAAYPPQYRVDLLPIPGTTLPASVAAAGPTPPARFIGLDDPTPVSSDSMWYRFPVGGQIKVTLDTGAVVRGHLVYKAGESIVVRTDHGQETFERLHVKAIGDW